MSHHDPFDTAAQEDAKSERAERAKFSEQQELDDLKWLMGSKRGRRMVWRQLDRAGVFRLSFNTNAMTMAFAEGNKNEGLRTLALIQASCPELLLQLLKERASE